MFGGILGGTNGSVNRADGSMLAKPILTQNCAYHGNFSQFLENVPLFRGLSKVDYMQLATAMQSKNYPAGSHVVETGSKGDAFFVIISGEADVVVHRSNFIQVGQKCHLAKDVKIAGKVYTAGTETVVDKIDATRSYPFTVRILATGDRGRVLPTEVEGGEGSNQDKVVCTLRAGDYFGERALIYGTTRNATIVSSTDMTCGVLPKDKFDAIGLARKLQFPKRHAVHAHHDDDDDPSFGSKDTSKNSADREFIRAAILANNNLKTLLPIVEAEIDRMVDVAYKRQVSPGDQLMAAGQIFGREFFIVQSGEYEFTVPGCVDGEAKSHAFELMKNCKPGASFGEEALVHHVPRTVSVTCRSPGSIWIIDQSAFKNILLVSNRDAMMKYIKVFDTIQIFNCLLTDEKEALAEALYQKHFIKGEYLLEEGKMSEAFFILLEGQVVFLRGDKPGKVLDAAKTKGLYFGEQSILKSMPSTSSVKAMSDDVVCCMLSKADFERILAGPLEDLMNEHESNPNRASKVSLADVAGTPAPLEMTNVKMTDLKRLGLLGCGGFGAVTLEQHKTTGRCFAMKELSKGYIVKSRMQKSTLQEKRILQLCNSDFIIKLFATFKTHDSLFFLLEPALGGELYATYHKYRFHGDAPKAQFYSGSVVFAFEHLHERNVIYRDLKPENLLMDDKGLVKLTDMGLAKETMTKTYTTCGTPDYFAPEVIERTGQNCGVDWWTLGILIHELLTGHPPFESSQPAEIYKKVVRGVNYVTFSYGSKEPLAVDLVKKMLCKNASDRLPMLSGGTANIKSHPWFSSFTFNDLGLHRVSPPYKPQVKSMTDTSNFRCREQDRPPKIPYIDDGTGWDEEF